MTEGERVPPEVAALPGLHMQLQNAISDRNVPQIDRLADRLLAIANQVREYATALITQ